MAIFHVFHQFLIKIPQNEMRSMYPEDEKPYFGAGQHRIHRIMKYDMKLIRCNFRHLSMCW